MLRVVLVIAVVAAVAFVAGFGVGQSTMFVRPTAKEPRQNVEVARVIDGDTVELADYVPPEPMDESARLLFVDTPERDEEGFEEATAFVEDLLSEGDARVEFDEGQGYRDRFGRLLVLLYVVDEDGGERLVNLELVRERHSEYETQWGEPADRELREIFEETAR